MLERELEYRIPRLHSPVNSRIFSEIAVRTKQASCRLSWKSAFSRSLQQTSVGNRSPYPLLSTFCKGGVQWKQGVVVYMTLYTSLLYNITPIHCTHLPLHPPLLSIHTRVLSYLRPPSALGSRTFGIRLKVVQLLLNRSTPEDHGCLV